MQPGTSDSTTDVSLDAPAGVSLPPVDVLLDDQTAPDALDGEAGTPAPGAIRYRLPMVSVPDNVLLKAAVQKLVEQKAQLDALARQGNLPGLHPNAREPALGQAKQDHRRYRDRVEEWIGQQWSVTSACRVRPRCP